jgi:hypothetical protein
LQGAEVADAVLVQDHGLTIEYGGADGQAGRPKGDGGKAMRPVVPPSRKPVAVPFHLEGPLRAGPKEWDAPDVAAEISGLIVPLQARQLGRQDLD